MLLFFASLIDQQKTFPFDGETSPSTHAERRIYPLPFLLALCHLSLGCVDIVYLSSQANKRWQKEHRFYRNNSNNAMVAIIMTTVMTACSFFFPKSAKQF